MQLILALACDDARVRPDGKLDVMGIFNELSAPGFPAAQERMTVVFVIQWDRHESGRMPLRADLVDEADRPILTIQGHTDVDARPQDRAPAQTRLVLPLQEVVFPAPGTYRFELRVGATRLPAFSLFVGQRGDGALPDPAPTGRV